MPPREEDEHLSVPFRDYVDQRLTSLDSKLQSLEDIFRKEIIRVEAERRSSLEKVIHRIQDVLDSTTRSLQLSTDRIEMAITNAIKASEDRMSERFSAQRYLLERSDAELRERMAEVVNFKNSLQADRAMFVTRDQLDSAINPLRDKLNWNKGRDWAVIGVVSFVISALVLFLSKVVIK